MRTVRITRDEPARAATPFRMADGRNGHPLDGRLRFRVYNLHDSEGLDLDINDDPIPVDAIIERRNTNRLVEDLMGKKPEKRFQFIQDNAQFAEDLDV